MKGKVQRSDMPDHPPGCSGGLRREVPSSDHLSKEWEESLKVPGVVGQEAGGQSWRMIGPGHAAPGGDKTRTQSLGILVSHLVVPADPSTQGTFGWGCQLVHHSWRSSISLFGKGLSPSRCHGVAVALASSLLYWDLQVCLSWKGSWVRAQDSHRPSP